MSAVPEPVLASGDALYMERADAVKKRLDAQIGPAFKMKAELLKDLPIDVTGVPVSCGLMKESEVEITELDATAVVEKIANGELTAVETVSAFAKRAAIAHQLVNCLVDFFLDEALEQARQLDNHFKQTGKVVGPLHGLPISIKEHIPIKGRWGSDGFAASIEQSKEDCHMTSILRSLGAVFYVKTNQPQTIMHLETHSVYGRTLNPHNTNLTPGGSSGGESALLTMKGSCMGVGTDGGGSIRAPCAHCGLYGMKPTILTMPISGYLWYQPGNDGIITSTGPMCRSARDINLFMSAVRSTQPALEDPLMIPLPWNVPASLGRKLRVGMMMHDGVVMPQPAMLRALEAAQKKLEASADVEVVQYVPYKHDVGYGIAREMYFEDGGKKVRERLSDFGEQALPLTEWVISPPFCFEHDAAGVWDLRARRDKFRQEYSDHWNASRIDVLLCPPFPGTAPPHDTSTYWGYTAIFNTLDYPGIVFPSGLKLDPALDSLHTTSEPLSEADKYNCSIYDPEVMIGAPVSYQVIARRFNDCMLVAAQRLVGDILNA